jgi:hypothetical protein
MASAASSAAPSPPTSSPPEPVAPPTPATPPPPIAVTVPETPPAVAAPAQAPVQPPSPVAEPASPSSPSSASRATFSQSRLTGEELEEKKKQFRMEQMARREANLAKREAARKADSSAYSRQQREMQEVFATGDVDLFAAKFLRPTAAAQPVEEQPKAPEAPKPTLAAIAQSVAVRAACRMPRKCIACVTAALTHARAPDLQPTQSDEQRVLLALVEQLAAERAAAKEREAAEKVLRIQDTLVNVLPPRRTQESMEAEAARQYDLARQQESSCVVQ